MILVFLKKQNLFLVKEKPKILGFFIIKGGWGLDVDDWHWIYIWLDCWDLNLQTITMVDLMSINNNQNQNH